MKSLSKILIVAAIVLAAFLLGRCSRPGESAVERVRTKVEYVAAEKQVVHDTIAVLQVKQVVTVKKVFVPIVEQLPGKTVYLRKDSTIYVKATADSAGLTIDSMAMENKQRIVWGDEGKGKVTVSVRNSNPFFKQADVAGASYTPKRLPRLGFGLYAGAGWGPLGMQGSIGIGVLFNAMKRE